MMGHLFILDKIKLWAKKCQPIFFKNTPFFETKINCSYEAWDTLAIHQKISNRIEKAPVKIIFRTRVNLKL